MSHRIYVGNLPYTTTEESLAEHFANLVGEVIKTQIIVDRITGRSKGFAFVEFSEPIHVEKAISELNGSDMGGRTIKVSLAKPVVPRPPRSGFGRQKF